jgi:hypothetical protein
VKAVLAGMATGAVIAWLVLAFGPTAAAWLAITISVLVIIAEAVHVARRH